MYVRVCVCVCVCVCVLMYRGLWSFQTCLEVPRHKGGTLDGSGQLQASGTLLDSGHAAATSPYARTPLDILCIVTSVS